MWEKGEFEIDGIKMKYEAKVFETGSRFGINGGRISKMEVVETEKKWGSSNESLIGYDRDWWRKPKTVLTKKALEYLLELYK